MRKFLLSLALVLLASPALAQNVTCPDRPHGDSTNACANTRFVQQNAGGGGGGSPGGLSGQIQYNNSGSFGGFTANGDATINPINGVVNVTASGGVPFGDVAFQTLGASFSQTVLGGVCNVASNILWNSAGTWVCQSLGTLSANLGNPISLMFYIPTPSSDDTTNFNLAISDCAARGGCELSCPASVTYTVTQISLPSNTRLSGKCTIQQKTAGIRLILIDNKTNIEINGISLSGTLLVNYATNGCGSPTPPCSGQTSYISGDNAIYVTNSTNIKVRNTYITEFGYVAVWFINSSRIWVENNYLYSVAQGIYFYSSSYTTVRNNTLLHTSYYSNNPTTSQFAVGIAYDAVSSVAPRSNYYFTVEGNKIIEYPYGQGILMHDGAYGTIANNVVNNVSQGIATAIASGYPNSGLNNITITGNSLSGPQIASIPTPTQGAIIVNGASGQLAANIAITGNVATNFGNINPGATTACIGSSFVNQLSIVGNNCQSNYGNGIELDDGITNVLVNSNNINGVTSAGGSRNGIWARNTTTGIISSNLINSAGYGVLVGGSTTNIKYTGLQQCISVSSACTSP